tara:strand:+ start:1776 stop:3320 length:1545 start_codon:yes stop_codon:yes gene_type:complete
MSRVNKSLKNAKIGVFFFVISIFVQFFTRKIFLEYLGDDFIGLASTLRSILGFLNLIELGIGTAIGFTLYKPIFDKNYNEINKIIALLGILYRKIGLIILVIGIIISLFFPLFFPDVQFTFSLIYFAFYSFLISSLLGYFVNFHLALLDAEQKGYIIQGYFQTFNIIRLSLQALVSYYFQSFYLWISLELIFSVLYSITLRIIIKKHYSWLIINSKEKNKIIKEYPEVIKKIKQLFVHKIGSFVKDGTDNILVYFFINLQSVAFFGNYQLIFMKLTGLVKMVFSGTAAGIGNLVAENDKKNIEKVFWEMQSLQFFIAGFFGLCIYYLLEPFIVLWIGTQYILDKRVLTLMVAIFFIGQIRSPVEHFKNAYGLFSDTWAPAAEAILNLIISYIFGKLWGIAGIMFGTFVSLIIIVLLWKPYFLYKNGFKSNVLKYWKGFIQLLFVFSVSAIIVNLIFKDVSYEKISNFYLWFICALKFSSVIFIVYSLLLYISIPSFRVFCLRIYSLLMSRFQKK